MNTLYDPTALREIIHITCAILKDHFFYDKQDLKTFISAFSGEMAEKLHFFEQNADKRIIRDIHKSRITRLYFTCYFVSANLRAVFIESLHFSEQELALFENMLPDDVGEYIGELL